MRDPQDIGLSFTPTPHMRRFARTCADPDPDADTASRCGAAGVSQATLARWQALEGFTPWLQEEVRRLLGGALWEVWLVVYRMAKAGNLNAAKLLLDRLDPGGAPDDIAPRTFQELAAFAEADDEGDDS